MTTTTGCRTCGGEGLRGEGVRCPSCGGAWVDELSLIDLVADAVDLPLSGLAWQARAATTPRPCEHCAAPMTPVALYGVELDRCAGHGIWLDVGELERVLHAAPHHTAWTRAGSTADIRSDREPWVSNALLGDANRLDDTGGVLGALLKLLEK